jgi:ubiquinone/menaquinone biosynthesis C-methylase UbiE
MLLLRTTRTLLIGWLALAMAWVGWADEPPPMPDPPNPLYEKPARPSPDGIGKSFMGREIARVMSYHGAAWLDRPEREKEEAPSKLLPALKIRPGDVVADIGAGSGYYTLKLAELVGPKGKVYAVDIQDEMLQIIRRKMKKANLTNIELVKGGEKTTNLPKSSVDLMLLVDVYHEFAYPYEMTKAMLDALKPGGRLVFVEFRLEDENVPIRLLHKMSEQQVKREMSIHPLTHVETLGHLPWQHVIIFSKKGP